MKYCQCNFLKNENKHKEWELSNMGKVEPIDFLLISQKQGEVKKSAKLNFLMIQILIRLEKHFFPLNNKF